jgi:hypothetical protein
MGDAWLARCEGCRTGRLPEESPAMILSAGDFYWDWLMGGGFAYIARRRWREGEIDELPDCYRTLTERAVRREVIQ